LPGIELKLKLHTVLIEEALSKRIAIQKLEKVAAPRKLRHHRSSEAGKVAVPRKLRHRRSSEAQKLEKSRCRESCVTAEQKFRSWKKLRYRESCGTAEAQKLRSSETGKVAVPRKLRHRKAEVQKLEKVAVPRSCVTANKSAYNGKSCATANFRGASCSF
jgi:hypothetical protein